MTMIRKMTLGMVGRSDKNKMRKATAGRERADAALAREQKRTLRAERLGLAPRGAHPDAVDLARAIHHIGWEWDKVKDAYLIGEFGQAITAARALAAQVTNPSGPS